MAGLWLKLSADIFQNRKIEALSTTAKLLYIVGLCEAKNAGSTGRFAVSSIPRLLATILDPDLDNRLWRVYPGELIRAGLWEPIGDDGEPIALPQDARPARDRLETRSRLARDFRETCSRLARDVRIHDWEDYQYTESEVDRERRKNAERQARFRERQRLERDRLATEQTDRNGVTNNEVTDTELRDRVKSKSNVSASTLLEDNQSTGKDKKGAREKDTAEALIEPATAPKPEKRGARLAPDWQPTERLREWALADLEYDARRVDFELAAFRDYWAGNGGTKLDWEATFRNWLRNDWKRRFASGGIAKNGTRPQNGRHYQTSSERLAAIANGEE